MKKKAIPGRCPVCGEINLITEISCSKCDTHIKGQFDLCRICNLPPELYEFTIHFLMARGNIKEVEKRMEISYPTVRNRLDQVLQHLGVVSEPEVKVNKLEILKKVETGEITPQKAIELLKGKVANEN